MKKGTTLFLRGSVILMGIPVIAGCIFLVPAIARYTTKLLPNTNYIEYIVSVYFYITAIPFYLALYQAFKLLNYIDDRKAFSELSVIALKKIKYCAISISMLYVVGMPLFYLIGDKDDAPGVIVIGLLIIFASMVISVFANVLQRLLKEAIDIKLENDLTV